MVVALELVTRPSLLATSSFDTRFHGSSWQGSGACATLTGGPRPGSDRRQWSHSHPFPVSSTESDNRRITIDSHHLFFPARFFLSFLLTSCFSFRLSLGACPVRFSLSRNPFSRNNEGVFVSS